MKKTKHHEQEESNSDKNYAEALDNSPIDSDFESILAPNENDLVRDWQVQPKLYFEYAQDLAKARSELDYAEAELKVVKAEIDGRIRRKPNKYGLADKPTEVSIANTILLQVSHQKAQQKVHLAQERVNMLDAAVRALDHKKAALENMVRLHGQSYFSTPTATAEDNSFLDEQRKKTVRRK